MLEKTPITENDSFIVIERQKEWFDFPAHCHSEYELNFIQGAKGALRVVGDHIEEIDDLELIMVANGELPHHWQSHNNKGVIKETTIQFPADLIGEKWLIKNRFLSIQNLFNQAYYGVTFSKPVVEKAAEIIPRLISNEDSFEHLLDFLRLLKLLSTDENLRRLSTPAFFAEKSVHYGNKRVEDVIEYVNKNFREQIRLPELAVLMNMSESSLTRQVRMSTGKTLSELINDVRVGTVSRMLVENRDMSIAEIAYSCGFNNISNFNRIFKKCRGKSPNEFREIYYKKRVII